MLYKSQAITTPVNQSNIAQLLFHFPWKGFSSFSFFPFAMGYYLVKMPPYVSLMVRKTSNKGSSDILQFFKRIRTSDKSPDHAGLFGWVEVVDH